jgi:hypothetical protein
MRTRTRILAALAAAVALGAAACSTEQLSLTLAVGAFPDRVAGAPDAVGGRSWEWQVAITNPEPVGIFLEYYHTGVTDTGFEQPLQAVKNDPVLGRRIAPGGTLSFVAARRSEGQFSRGTERRIYHALGDDGRYYSGEVRVRLE